MTHRRLPGWQRRPQAGAQALGVSRGECNLCTEDGKGGPSWRGLGSESRCEPLGTDAEMQEIQQDFLITPFSRVISGSLPCPWSCTQFQGLGKANRVPRNWGAGQRALSAPSVYTGLFEVWAIRPHRWPLRWLLFLRPDASTLASGHRGGPAWRTERLVQFSSLRGGKMQAGTDAGWGVSPFLSTCKTPCIESGEHLGLSEPLNPE